MVIKMNFLTKRMETQISAKGMEHRTINSEEAERA